MIQAIKDRRSIRTFEGVLLSSDDKEKINSLMAQVSEIKGPFSHTIHLEMVENIIPGKKQGIIGTYGFVKNAPAFIVGVSTKEFKHLVDYGFIFEHMVLELTKIGLGTVWLGGTFNRKNFELNLEKDEFIPAITPVGYPAEKPSLRERAIRTMAKADDRKPFESLFFNQSFDKPLKRKAYPVISKILDLVQSAPSASNKQPWRIVVESKHLHLYLKESKNYIAQHAYNIQALDIGIAAAHIAIGLKDKKMAFDIEENDHAPTADGLRYICSFKLKKAIV